MKKLALLSALYLLVALTFNSCKKDNFTPPEVQSLSIKANSLSSITFTGNVLNVGNQNTKDYGFIYSTTNSLLSETSGTKVSLGSNPTKGEFSKTIDIAPPSVYYSNAVYARAYITDENGTVFGTTLITQLPQPYTNNINPSAGKVGDIIKFYGKFHSPTLNNVSVTFNAIKGRVVSVSDAEIAVEVPSGIVASHGQYVTLNLVISGVTAFNAPSFTMLANIKDFSPKTGTVGSNVSLIGDNLPSSYSGNYPLNIYFGDALANNGYYYGSQVTVPFTASAKSQVSVVVNGQKVTLPGDFTVIAPQVTAVNPASGILPGQTLYISGTNFPTQSDASAGRPMVKLGNGDYQNVYLQSTNVYYLNTSSALADGDYTLSLRIGPHEVQAPDKVKILPYTATSFSPATGGPGKEVNISGNFIQGSSYYVYFGTATTYATATSATNLRTFVPSGTNAGTVKISVDLPNKKIVLPGNFEVVGPTFTSFLPTSGVAGTQITIKGTNFSPGTYNTSVKFGTVAVTPISVTENTIVVAVPSNVNPGAMKLSVVTGGQTVVHNDNFTITN
ncbi:IPT/TIG domain-containing protein [Pedobacter sp.]